MPPTASSRNHVRTAQMVEAEPTTFKRSFAGQRETAVNIKSLIQLNQTDGNSNVLICCSLHYVLIIGNSIKFPISAVLWNSKAINPEDVILEII